jgi:hypothetical protein
VNSYIFSTDLGPVVAQVTTLVNFDVDDIIHNRAMSQALAVSFLNIGKTVSPNDPKAARTITSAFSSSTEELLS